MALEWTKAIQTGDAEIDAIHQRLFDLLVQIDGVSPSDKKQLLAAGLLGDLLALLKSLFAREDMVMAAANYPQHVDHCDDHGAMLALLESAISRRRADAAVVDTIVFTAAGHIETKDMPLAAFMRQQASKPRPPNRWSGEGETPMGRVADSRRRALARPAWGPSSEKSDSERNLETMVLDTYTQTLLTLKSAKGLTGDRAKVVAYTIVATAVSQATGRKIRPEMVAQFVKLR